MKSWKPGDYISYSGYVGGKQEIRNLKKCANNQWWTIGEFSEKFYNKLRDYLKVKHVCLCNSGSSANLLAISALTSPKLKNRLKPGDEVITTACSFPTTVAPIIQNKLVPVFADIGYCNFNMITDGLEGGISNKTKAIFLTHSFGNPRDMDRIMQIAKKHNLWVISDCCDALGAKWNGKSVESYGDLATGSFYPAHHITTGEGGAVFTNNSELARIVQSFRDWGRDCWCKPGDISKCKNRWNFKTDDLPEGYDHKYIFSHIGYNLKMTDMQASIGCAQIDRLDGFIEKRNSNFKYLFNIFYEFGKNCWLPDYGDKAQPSWFCFPFTHMNRTKLINFLENKGIQTRLLFAGNILCQPAFKNIKYRIVNNLSNTNFAMKHSMFLGVYPGLTKSMLNYIGKSIKEYFNG